MLHANTDCCLSLWAAMHSTWMCGSRRTTRSTGHLLAPTTPPLTPTPALFPFPNSQDTDWTSPGGTDIARLRSTYPDFDSLDMSDPGALRKTISKVVSNLYIPHYLSDSISLVETLAAPSIDTNTTTITITTNTDSATTATTMTDTDVAISTTTTKDTAPILTIWAWSARVRVKQSELSSSFQVLLFLGPVPEDPREWAGAPAYVGAFGAFVNGTTVRGANCQERLDAVTEGYVPLQDALARDVRVCSFEPGDVRPYLKDELDWRVQMADGTPVPLERLPSLEVTVVAMQLSRRSGDILPVLVGEPVHHRDVTSGRLGGAQPT